MEENYIEKTVARLEHYRENYARKIALIDQTIAVIRALTAEEAALSLVAELPAAVEPQPAAPARPQRKVPPSGKKSLPLGVVAVKSRHMGIRYKARPYENGKLTYLGTFETPEAAAAAIEEYKAGKAKPTDAAAKPKTKKSRGHSSSKKRGGKFVGVRVVGNRIEGQAWDSENRKVVYLGRFDTDIAAAIAVAKYKGDSDEVRRLSDMLERAENNPDTPNSRPRPTGKRTYPVTEEPKIVYRCKHCGLEFQSKPTQCIGCNSSSFEEVENAG